MLWLGLDTSTRLGSVAIADGEQLLAESTLSLRATRSEQLLPEIDRLLRSCAAAPADLEAVVVGAGPGSFTGVRIAAAVAKGYCFGLDIPLYAYSSLAVVVAGTGVDERVCALFDARRGEVYAAAYRRLSPLRAELEPSAHRIEELLGRLPSPGEWCFAGDGATRYAAAIAAVGGRTLGPHLGVPRASALLWMAHRDPEAGRVVEPAAWEPLYVRASGARRAAGRAPATAGAAGKGGSR